jgi:protein ImuA
MVVTPLFSARISREGPPTFEPAWRRAAERPLAEITPAAFADRSSALGFALAWLTASSGRSDPLVWVVPDDAIGEDGVPYAPGLAQFGFALPRLLLVRVDAQVKAFWAAEQALAVPRARVLCSIAENGKLTLPASRRLLLAAEKSGARGLLLRFDALAASASWSRWRVAAAPSAAAARELGRPSFLVTLERDRSGLAGRCWFVEWSADDHAFRQRPEIERALAGDLAEQSADGSTAPRRLRAV